MNSIKETLLSGWARGEMLRVALLVIVTSLLWCTTYNRWTLASWQTPLDYLADIQTGDVVMHLAWTQAAADGHVLPFMFTNVPELGAPGTANWDDFPTPERPIFWLTGLLARGLGLFAGANLAILLEQIATAVAFYAACRVGRAHWAWAMTGAMLFAFSRFAFAQGLHHITIVYYWHVPLCLLVCEWIFRGEGIGWRDRRLNFALAVAFVTGMQNVYYSWIFVQLISLGGIYQAWRRGWREVLPAGAIVASCAAAFLLVNSSSIFYALVHGYNGGAVVRPYSWLEFYGLKLVDLIVPPPDHSFPFFSIWGTSYVSGELFPGEIPPSGYLGVLGVAALAWLIVASWQRAARRMVLPLEALFVLWIILYSVVGGLNCLLGSLGFLLFRATSRYSIVILCLILMYAVRRLSALEFKPPALLYALAIGAVIFGWWDQTPPIVTDRQLQELAAEVSSDRHFVESLEQQLPAGAMIFQVPVMDFPESPVQGVGPYAQLRPYLYAHSLRFSFGTDKGRPAAQWQHQFEGLPLPSLISQLEDAGFSGIYIMRSGYADNGAGLLNAFKKAGLTHIVESERGDLFCVLLNRN